MPSARLDLTRLLQNGMFSYTGLTPGQVQTLKQKYHVYLLKSGRASISGCRLPIHGWNQIKLTLGQ
jgi:aspartate/tyrosine/aromatic aminotransferase